jgi:hypothetical protein
MNEIELTPEMLDFSNFLTNMSPNQPRDKNGRWSKTKGGVLFTKNPNNPASPSASFDLHDPVGLSQYLSHKAKTKISPMNMKKLQILNPHGIKNGEITIPKNNKDMLELVKTLMPKGTKIKAQHVTAADLNKAPTQHLTPTSTPTPQPSVTSKPSTQAKGLRPLPAVSSTELTYTKHLGGSTGATLVKDHTGKEFVLKKENPGLPDPKGFINNEIHADAMYRAAGASVPHSGPVTYPDGSVGKRGQYLNGSQSLSEWYQGKSQTEIDAMHKEIGKHFVMDALMANRDVVGQSFDNIVIHQGKPFRVDNGGSLEYRAQGEKKQIGWSSDVKDIDSMRNSSKNPNAAKVFGHLTDHDIRLQMFDTLLQRKDILDATPDHLKKIMGERFDNLKQRHDNLLAKINNAPTPSTQIPLSSTTFAGLPSSVGTSATVSTPLSSTFSTQPQSLPFGGQYQIGKPGSKKPIFQIVPATSLIETGIQIKFDKKITAPTTAMTQWASSLSTGERNSIKEYTDSSYGAYRVEVAAGPPYKQHISDFISAVEKAPKIDGPATVFRGVRDGEFTKELIDQIKQRGIGSIITESAHQSTTRNPDKAFVGSKNGVLFQITSKTARHIESLSSYKSEQELLTLPNTQYRVLRIIEDGTFTTQTGMNMKPKLIVHIEEI